MKSQEPQKITGFIALGFLVLAGLFFLANYLSPNLYYSLAISVPLFFALSFSMVNFFVNRFIYSRIKPIYKSIHDFKPSQLDDEENAEDVFSSVNKEVASWMQDKTQQIQELQQMEQYRKEFLGNVSHELKTPIFNIQGYILTLMDGGLDDPNINSLYLNRTEKSIDRMISIIDDLEAISKLEAGELELTFEPFNLIQLVDDVFDLQDIRAKEKNIKLKYGKGFERDIQVIGDKQRLFQVISNLVVNSINYGKKGGNTSLNFYDMDNRVLIEIKDNGIGIAEENLPRIFERFYRADKSRSREQGGTGLGLAIVKHIIEAHKQRINVSSKIGKGTSFTFTLEKAR
ncbi:sensor histidine kinase [Carboxylicivirga sp. N1Y90]|uniref:sensor histidine kinase n=1 Tax=Carboxylicivirga fragile TaxID=3417571 RepID=UPI003D345C8F|nr:sensor histidine kinase [Marinilabiliaceae bacterium N1Y90]